MVSHSATFDILLAYIKNWYHYCFSYAILPFQTISLSMWQSECYCKAHKAFSSTLADFHTCVVFYCFYYYYHSLLCISFRPLAMSERAFFFVQYVSVKKNKRQQQKKTPGLKKFNGSHKPASQQALYGDLSNLECLCRIWEEIKYER